jgi:hypothetical protein
MTIERTFNDISEESITKADRQDFLVNLGWSNGIGWNDLFHSKRVLIISEAGTGKTFECRAQCKLLWDAGEPSFFLDLATLANSSLRDMLTYQEEARFEAWLSSQSDIATFFLDSIDELKLSLGSFEKALKTLNKGIRDKLAQVRIIITTRPIPFDSQLVHHILPIPNLRIADVGAESFALVAMNKKVNLRSNSDVKIQPEWRTVALMPLSDAQIMSFAKGENVLDATELLADIHRRNALEFARRPQDLIELCADWRSFKRIRTHREQVETNIRVKLKPREDRKELADLSVDRAIEGACKLALALILTRRLTIRHSADADKDSNDAALDPANVLTDWSINERKALLERPLFGFASYGRVRFHHRSITEYLAAVHLRNLRNKGMPISALKRLLFAETKGKLIVRPSKRPIAGWLALTESWVFELLRDNEPVVLFNEGDPESLTLPQRIEALSAFVKRYSDGGWRGLSVPQIQIQRFASYQVSDEINRLWQTGIENQEIREILLNLIEAGKIEGCAEIVYETAVNKEASDLERIFALDALIAIDDERLSQISPSVTHDRNLWPETLLEGAILRLFPSHLSVTQLCQLMVGIKVKKHGLFNFSWQLSNQIKKAKLNVADLGTLRYGLVELVSSGLRWQKTWPNIVSDHSEWCNVLAITCVLGLQLEESDEWLYASILSLRLHVNNQGDNEEINELGTLLSNLNSSSNERLFWLADKLIQSLKEPKDTPWDRLWEIAELNNGWMINFLRDWDWISCSIADTSKSTTDRAMLLEAMMNLAQHQNDPSANLKDIKSLVADSPDLMTVINEYLKRPSPSEAQIRRESEQAKRKDREERRETKASSSWILFWQEISDYPDRVFSDEHGENTAWNLWKVMQNGEEASHTTGWNRRIIEAHFGKDIADRLRLTLMGIWRKYRPTLPSERPDDKKNSYLTIWRLGLVAIYAEAEDQDWATKLSEEEAQLAARYAQFELNGLPPWFYSLISTYPEAVDITLGNEISVELDKRIGEQNHSMLLQSISYASQAVALLLIPRLWVWFDSKGDLVCDEELPSWAPNRVQKVLDIILKHGDHDDLKLLKTVAKHRLDNGLPKELDFIWLKTLIRLEANVGVEYLENRIRGIKPEQNSEAIGYFNTLFRNRHDAILLPESNFSPGILLRLLRLAYYHIRPEDDQVHEGSCTANARDNAERVRSEIVNALFNVKGVEGWKAKLEMAADPLCAHFKDRIIAVAEENCAIEIDAMAFSEEQVIAINRTGEAPATTSEDMFRIMVDRLDDLNDLLLQDISPREVWAGISEERVMRREIARELSNKANGLYKVDQESVTADEKETDIRLRSTASDKEAIIELKLANNRTLTDLRDTIKKQLVTKYMAPANSRSGCLMVTLSTERKWIDPIKKSKVGFPQLIDILKKEAAKIVDDLGGSLDLHVCGLDLRQRLSKEK